MNYDLQILYETDEAFNCDVITADEEKYMGRLYILTTDDNTLKNLGIKEEWYLAHEEADVLVSGHIKTKEERRHRFCASARSWKSGGTDCVPPPEVFEGWGIMPNPIRSPSCAGEFNPGARS